MDILALMNSSQADPYAPYALIISVVSLIASALSAFYARRQAHVSQESVEFSRRSANAAEESAKAANVSAETADLSTRAWITVESVRVSVPDNRQVPKSAEAHYLNSGPTPAQNISGQAWLRAFKGRIDLPLHDSAVVHYGDLGGGCGGNIKADLSHSDNLSQEIVQEVQNLYFYGELNFAGVSGKKHNVNWCYRYLPKAQQFHSIKTTRISGALRIDSSN